MLSIEAVTRLELCTGYQLLTTGRATMDRSSTMVWPGAHGTGEGGDGVGMVIVKSGLGIGISGSMDPDKAIGPACEDGPAAS